MYFLKKAWPFAIAAIVMGIGVFLFGRANKPVPPVTIYKVIQPTPKADEAQHTRADVAGHVHTPPESTSKTDHRSSSPIELRETEGEEIISNAEGNTHTSVVEEEPTSDIAEGEVPPELSEEARERRREEYNRQQQRVLEIREEIERYADNSNGSRAEHLRLIELTQELLRIQQERGMLYEDTDGAVSKTFQAFEFFKTVDAHTTDDGRFPTAKADVLIEAMREHTPDSPEKQIFLERINRIVATAIENGDEYLDPNLDFE